MPAGISELSVLSFQFSWKSAEKTADKEQT
jgi:hypothetical protein